MSIFVRRFYIRMSSTRVSVDSPGVARGFDDTAVIAVRTENENKIVAAIGESAEKMKGTANVELFRPFSHPRLVFDDYATATKILQHAIRSLHQQIHWTQIRPLAKVIMHPLRAFEGGLTDVERYSLIKLADLCGARQVAIYTGRELTELEVEEYGRADKCFQPTSQTPFGRPGRG